MKMVRKFCSIFIVLVLSSCNPKDNTKEYSDFLEGYIVGSFTCSQVDDETGQANDDTGRGFCILTENNFGAQEKMDFYTFDLPDGLFNFPEELISGRSDGNNCGPCFFPENQRTNFKIKFRYRVLTGKEKIKFSCGPCTAMYPPFSWDKYNEVSLKDVTDVNP